MEQQKCRPRADVVRTAHLSPGEPRGKSAGADPERACSLEKMIESREISTCGREGPVSREKEMDSRSA